MSDNEASKWRETIERLERLQTIRRAVHAGQQVSAENLALLLRFESQVTQEQVNSWRRQREKKRQQRGEFSREWFATDTPPEPPDFAFIDDLLTRLKNMASAEYSRHYRPQWRSVQFDPEKAAEEPSPEIKFTDMHWASDIHQKMRHDIEYKIFFGSEPPERASWSDTPKGEPPKRPASSPWDDMCEELKNGTFGSSQRTATEEAKRAHEEAQKNENDPLFSAFSDWAKRYQRRTEWERQTRGDDGIRFGFGWEDAGPQYRQHEGKRGTTYTHGKDEAGKKIHEDKDIFKYFTIKDDAPVLMICRLSANHDDPFVAFLLLRSNWMMFNMFNPLPFEAWLMGHKNYHRLKDDWAKEVERLYNKGGADLLNTFMSEVWQCYVAMGKDAENDYFKQSVMRLRTKM